MEEDRPLYLFGDGDLDGVVSTLVVVEALEALGCVPTRVLFAHRAEYGYGLSDHFVSLLKEEEPGLLLVFDCGRGNRTQLAELKEAGFNIVVVDHHPYGGVELPVDQLINPKEVEDEAYLAEACTAGLAMVLYEHVLRGDGREPERSNVLDLVLIATIADMVPEEGINKEIMMEGFEVLAYSGRPALEALFSLSGVQPVQLDRNGLARAVLPILTSAVARDNSHEAYRLLREESYEKAMRSAELLLKRRRLHNRLTEAVTDEVRGRVDLEEPVVFEGGEDWPLFLAARAALNIAREFDKPVFLYRKGEVCQGSARGPEEVNLLDIMEPCAHLFENWGGHPPAAGFGFRREDEDKVRACLVRNLP